MKKNYIKEIRSKVGHQKIFLNFVVGALFDNDGKLLLQKRGDTSKWGLPGGAIELDEDFIQALKREFHEETGINVVPEDLCGIYTNKSHSICYPNGDECQPIVILYKVKPKSKINTNTKNSETLDLSFFEQNKLPQITNKQHKEMIEDSFRLNLNHVFRKI